jgi:hypothetical protein
LRRKIHWDGTTLPLASSRGTSPQQPCNSSSCISFSAALIQRARSSLAIAWVKLRISGLVFFLAALMLIGIDAEQPMALKR